MNNPTTTAISLTTFFKAYPISNPPKNPPPTVPDTEVSISMFIISSTSNNLSYYIYTLYIHYMYIVYG